MTETVTDLNYELPLSRLVQIHQTVDGSFTCTVRRAGRGVVQPGFFAIEPCIRWAQTQLVEIEGDYGTGEVGDNANTG